MGLSQLQFRGKPVYYGWVMVAALAVAGGVATALLNQNYGLFVDPMNREAGISSAYFGWSHTARSIGIATSAMFLGRLLDRYGSRVPLLFAGILIGGLVALMSLVSDGWQMVAIFFCMGLVGFQVGGTHLYSMVPVSRWFVRKRAKAVSIIFLSIPIGIILTTPLTQYLISSMGWRRTVLILGLIGGAVVVLASCLIKRAPEDLGLQPDGGMAGEEPGFKAERLEQRLGQPRVEALEYSWTRADAVRSAAFWKLAVAFGFSMFASSILALYRIPYFVNLGFDPQMISYALSVGSIACMGMTGVVNWALQRFEIRYVFVLSIALKAGALFIAINATGIGHVFLTMILLICGNQAMAISQGVIWPNYFGAKNIGSIKGLADPVVMVFAFTGPPIAGMVRDATGSYTPVIWAALVIEVFALLMFLVSSKPAVRQRQLDSLPSH